MLLLMFVILGIVAGVLAKGKFSGLIELRGLWFPIIAFAASSVPGYAPGISLLPKAAIISLSYFCSLAFVVLNRHYFAAAVLSGLGIISNYIVIAANGFRMPISEYALVYYPDMTAKAVLESRADYFVAVNGEAELLILGDVICVPVPYLGGFISVGDVFLAVGVFILIISAMIGAKSGNEYVFSWTPHRH